MDGPRHQLLAGPAFPGDEHCRFDRRHALDQVVDLAERCALADETMLEAEVSPQRLGPQPVESSHVPEREGRNPGDGRHELQMSLLEGHRGVEVLQMHDARALVTTGERYTHQRPGVVGPRVGIFTEHGGAFVEHFADERPADTGRFGLRGVMDARRHHGGVGAPFTGRQDRAACGRDHLQDQVAELTMEGVDAVG